MSLPSILQNLRLPLIAAPMFTVSYPELVLAQCRAGIVGSFPALNARPPALLDTWLTEIGIQLAAWRTARPEAAVGPLAVNQIIHPSNTRLQADTETCVAHQVPILITSLHAPPHALIDAVHAYGGIVLHDVTNLRHARKALDAGVDGLILVAAGAGGHGGTLSPFALVGEIRRIFDGLVVLSGAISNGGAILATQAMGADLAYMGTRFIATVEAHASGSYKEAIVAAYAADIVYTSAFTGVPGNYLRPSIVNAGLDPENLPAGGKVAMDLGSGTTKAWKDIWGAGQGVGMTADIPSVAELVLRLEAEYRQARAALL